MKKLPLYLTILILVVIAVGYFKNSLAIFNLIRKSQETRLFAASNWVVASIDPSLQGTLKLMPGDSILRVDRNVDDDFTSLDNQLVMNSGKTVSVSVMRQGAPVSLDVSLPPNFQSYLKERRIVFSPLSKGSVNVVTLTPFLKNRLMIGLSILILMGILSIVTAVLIYLGSKVGWLLGACIVIVGLIGSFEFQTTMHAVGHGIFFVILGVCLVASYKKDGLMNYLKVLLQN